MIQKILILFVLEFMILSLAACIKAKINKETGEVVGLVPAFTLTEVAGNNNVLFDYSDASSIFHDRTTILYFFATWSEYCQTLMPHVNTLHSKYRNNNTVLVIGIRTYIDRETENIYNFISNNNVEFVVLTDNSNNLAYNLFNLSGLPSTLIIDKYGNIRYGPTTYNEDDYADKISEEVDLIR